MGKKVHIEKVDSLLTERGIKEGDVLDVISEGPSDQRKRSTDKKPLMCYRVQGPIGTSIVVYEDEVKVIQ